MLEHRCRSQRKTDTCLRQDLNSAAHARLAGWTASRVFSVSSSHRNAGIAYM